MFTKFDLLYKPCCHCLRLGSRPAWTLRDAVLLFCCQSCTPYCSFQRSKWMTGNTKTHCICTSFPFILLDAKKSAEVTNEQMRLSSNTKKSTLPALCLPSDLTVCQIQQVLTPLLLGPQYSRMLFPSFRWLWEAPDYHLKLRSDSRPAHLMGSHKAHPWAPILCRVLQSCILDVFKNLSPLLALRRYWRGSVCTGCIPYLNACGQKRFDVKTHATCTVRRGRGSPGLNTQSTHDWCPSSSLPNLRVIQHCSFSMPILLLLLFWDLVCPVGQVSGHPPVSGS